MKVEGKPYKDRDLPAVRRVQAPDFMSTRSLFIAIDWAQSHDDVLRQVRKILRGS